jgi:flagellar assembly factor FliW
MTMIDMGTAPLSTAELEADAAIYFPDGLVGCPDWKRFVLLVEEDEDMPVAVLRSVEFPEVELLITDPALIDPAYRTHIDSPKSAVYCTLTVSDGWITANLLGPLVIDPELRQGRQLVLTDTPYTARHPVARASDES